MPVGLVAYMAEDLNGSLEIGREAMSIVTCRPSGAEPDACSITGSPA